jgi:hypothetical protein
MVQMFVVDVVRNGFVSVFCSCPFWQLVETEKITQQEDSKAEKASEKKSD